MLKELIVVNWWNWIIDLSILCELDYNKRRTFQHDFSCEKSSLDIEIINYQKIVYALWLKISGSMIYFNEG